MRLFLHQTVEREDETTPPFLTDRDEDVRFNLLRESTIHVKEGNQRLPTPEKNAIMELSTSFEKRRLGKQQQILTEMTQRCREQEVTDLSSKITAKCDLKLHAARPGNALPGRDNSFYISATNTFRGGNHRVPEVNSDLSMEANGNSAVNSPRTIAEKTYKFFPARHILRQPTKIHVFSTNLPKLNSLNNNKGGRHPHEAFMDSYRSPRYHNNAMGGGGSNTTNTNRYRRISHPETAASQQSRFAAPPHRSDPMAPLILPRLSAVDPNYQDRIDSYFSSSRMASLPRAKTFLDNASTSGRSYRSMLNLSNQLASRSNNGNEFRHVRSDRSELGIMQSMPRGVGDEDSMTSAGRGIGQSVDL